MGIHILSPANRSRIHSRNTESKGGAWNGYEATDALGRATHYTHDALGRILTSTDPAGHSIRYVYDPAGRLDSLIDPKGNATRFEYDEADRMIRTTNHLGVARNYEYDAQGKLTRYINGRGQALSYQYDALQRLTAKLNPDSTVRQRFGYDVSGNLVFASTSEYVVNRVYDQANRQIQEDITRSFANDTINHSDTISASDFSKDFTHLVVDGAQVVVDGEHHFLSLTLKNGANVTHLPTDTGSVHRVKIFARDSISIDSTSKIDVSSRGYLGGFRGGNLSNSGRTNDNTTLGGSSPGSGGSYGGRGGAYTIGDNVIGFAAFPYGTREIITQPGGGGGSNGNPGFNGGGVVHLNAPLIRIAGSVMANGEDAINENGGAGAGGGIVVEADSLFGRGNISAKGGNGIPGYGGPGGGGGGRILIAVNHGDSLNFNREGGANGGNRGSLIFIGSNSYSVAPLVVDAGETVRIGADNEAFEDAVVVVNEGTLIVNGTHQFKSLTLENGAVLTHDVVLDSTDSGLDLVIQDFVRVDSASKIDVSGKGFRGEASGVCAQTQGFACGSTGHSGGSHGGLGGSPDGHEGFAFGSITEPGSFGAGGGAFAASSASYGGRGGGAIRLAAPTIILEGQIRSHGAPGRDGGGGAGGSVLLFADSLVGTGGISATGGASIVGGGGGGGRIAIWGAHSALDLNHVWANGGYGQISGEAGTIYLGLVDSLILRNGSYFTNDSVVILNDTVFVNKENTDYAGMHVRIENGGIYTDGSHLLSSLTLVKSKASINGDVFTNTDFRALDSSLVTHPPTTRTQENKLDLLHAKGRFELDASSKVDVSAMGYRGEIYDDNLQVWLGARTLGNAQGSSQGSGGSYGGNGGYNSNPTSVTPTYGDAFEPGELGSGGSSSKTFQGDMGGDGGGFARITGNTLVVNGKIWANGSKPRNINIFVPGANGGGGSGGGLFLQADSIYGSGALNANGGDGQNPGGGGGRIALYPRSFFDLPLLNLSARGGANGGQRGTIVVHPVEGDSVLVLPNSLSVNSSDSITLFLGESDRQYEDFSIHMTGQGLEVTGNHRFKTLKVNKSHLRLIGDITVDSLVAINSKVNLIGTFTIPHITVQGGTWSVVGELSTDTVLLADTKASFHLDSLVVDTLALAAATVEMGGLVKSRGGITIEDGSILTHRATTLSQEYWLDIQVGTRLEVDTSSRIDVTGKGYLGDHFISSSNTWAGTRTLGNALGSSNGGGGYGGRGGRVSGSSGTLNTPYGHPSFPSELGSGGSSARSFTGDFGGTGGGYARILARSVLVQGEILAQGTKPGNIGGYDWYGGAGSGGGIFVQADSILGQGVLKANGGPGHLGEAKGGGGGRIALYGITISDSLTFRAHGGTGAGAGTVFLQDDRRPKGKLILDNQGEVGDTNSTPLPFIGPGIITGLSADTLRDDSASFGGYLAGHLLKLNYALAPAGQVFEVLSSTSNALAVDTSAGTLLSAGAVGDPYIGVYDLDTLVVKGGARVKTEDLVFYDSLILNNGHFKSHEDSLVGLRLKPSVRHADDRLASLGEGGIQSKRARTGTKSMASFYTGIRLNPSKEKGSRWVGSPDRLKAILAEAFAQSKVRQEGIAAEKKDLERAQVERALANSQREPDARVYEESGLKGFSKSSNWTKPVKPGILDASGKKKAYTYVPKFGQREETVIQLAVGFVPVCKKGDPVYTYDMLNRQTSMTTPVGTTNYEYDSTSGHLKKIVGPANQIFEFAYEKGELKNLSMPNGIVSHYEFNVNGDLQGIEHRVIDSTLKKIEYAYNADRSKASMQDNDGIQHYSQDPLKQIIGVSNPSFLDPIEQYAFDAVGNRLYGLDSSFVWQYNEANHLLENEIFIYNYDADGNRILQVEKASDDTTLFLYDIENQLIKVEKPGIIVEFSYDALGRRVKKKVNGSIKEYRFDSDNLILEVNQNDSIIANYVFGPGIDWPLSMERDNAILYYLQDGSGSVMALANEIGSIVQEYDYDVFGNNIFNTGGVENPFAFMGREWDGEVGMYYFRARYYDPKVGRFLQEDPISYQGQDINLYRFVKNNPTIFADPMGLAACYQVTPWQIVGYDARKLISERYRKRWANVNEVNIFPIGISDAAEMYCGCQWKLVGYNKVSTYAAREILEATFQCSENGCDKISYTENRRKSGGIVKQVEEEDVPSVFESETTTSKGPFSTGGCLCPTPN